jgi:hypothetical protein
MDLIIPPPSLHTEELVEEVPSMTMKLPPRNLKSRKNTEQVSSRRMHSLLIFK